MALSDRSLELERSRVPFVHACVVLAERPTSARPGDEALILPDGTIEGFVGGDCAESTVLEQSRSLLASGESTVVRITPQPEADQLGKVVVHNPCLSGGTLEIFLEPKFPPALLIVVGSAPIAQALLDLAERVDFEALPFDGALPHDTAAVVVASHGRDDEAAVLETALRAGVDYVGLVASPRRGAAVLASLSIDDELSARVRTPAGLDIGARTPPEIAVSILAEIIAQRPQLPEPATPHPSSAEHAAHTAASAADTATDPVCGMRVAMAATTLHLDHDGIRFWFCGPGCRQAFAADPRSFGA